MCLVRTCVWGPSILKSTLTCQTYHQCKQLLVPCCGVALQLCARTDPWASRGHWLVRRRRFVAGGLAGGEQSETLVPGCGTGPALSFDPLAGFIREWRALPLALGVVPKDAPPLVLP